MQSGFGPVRRSRAQWQSLLARAARSPLSVAEFCRTEGVSAASFYSWRKRLAEAGAPALPSAAPAHEPAFLDLGILGASARAEGDAGLGWEIELELGAGVVLRLRRG